jgi:hypothetical protein
MELLEQALLSEDVSMLDEMMEMIQNVKESGGHVPAEIDELTIRRMMIRMKINERDIKKNKAMKSAIMETWDQRIKKHENENEALRAVIEKWVRDTNKGKPLQLDVGTVSMRKVAHNIAVTDPIIFREWIKANGKEALFLKPAEFDVTAAKSDVIDYIDQTVDKMAEEELAKIQAADPEKKFTKAELKRRKDDLIKQHLPGVLSSVGLPENAAEYKAESQSVSLRFA